MSAVARKLLHVARVLREITAEYAGLFCSLLYEIVPRLALFQQCISMSRMDVASFTQTICHLELAQMANLRIVTPAASFVRYKRALVVNKFPPFAGALPDAGAASSPGMILDERIRQQVDIGSEFSAMEVMRLPSLVCLRLCGMTTIEFVEHDSSRIATA